MFIYVNGIKTNLINIFDYTKNHDNLGRKVEDILNDWVNCHTTYYYINNKKVYFALI
jgi:hypothetical protein